MMGLLLLCVLIPPLLKGRVVKRKGWMMDGRRETTAEERWRETKLFRQTAENAKRNRNQLHGFVEEKKEDEEEESRQRGMEPRHSGNKGEQCRSPFHS